MTSSSKSHFSGSVKVNQLTSLLQILPLLLFYEIGVLFTNVMNGADFLTQTLLHFLGIRAFIGIQLGILAICIGVALYLRRHQKLEARRFLPVFLESGIYALTMGSFILFVMVDVLGIDPHLSTGGGIQNASVFDRLVMSVGAGVYEEIVFRLIVLGGLTLLGTKVLKLRSWIAVVLAFIISSFLFSLAHHIGPLGEEFRLGVFIYRFIAGLFFAVLYQFRSLPIAIYTHALYDIYVMLLS